MSKDKTKKVERAEAGKDAKIIKLQRQVDGAIKLVDMGRAAEQRLLEENEALKTQLAEASKVYNEHVDRLKGTIDLQAAEVVKLKAMVEASITQPAATDQHQAAIEDAAEKAEA